MADRTNGMTWVDLIAEAWSRWPMLAAATLLGAGMGLAYWWAMPTTFRAHARIVPTVVAAEPPPEPADSIKLNARPPVFRIGANVLAAMSLSGEVIGAVLDELNLSETYTTDEFAQSLSAVVLPGPQDRDPVALVLEAEAQSLEEARRRANLWARRLGEHADRVADHFAEETQKSLRKELDRSNSELEITFDEMAAASQNARLATREQESFLLRQRYGQYLAQRSSLNLLVDIARGHVHAIATPPSESDRQLAASHLDARSEALFILSRIAAEQSESASGGFAATINTWLEKLALESKIVGEASRRIGISSQVDNPTEEQRAFQGMIAYYLAEASARLGMIGSSLQEPIERRSRPLDALGMREWNWPNKQPRLKFEEYAEPRADPEPPASVSPIWLPPLAFPAELLGPAALPERLIGDIRAASAAAERIQERLHAIREEIAAHSSVTSDLRWKAEQAKRRYDDARQASQLISRRVHEQRLDLLASENAVQIVSSADKTGSVVSIRAFASARTGAVLGFVLACLVILGKTTAQLGRPSVAV